MENMHVLPFLCKLKIGGLEGETRWFMRAPRCFSYASYSVVAVVAYLSMQTPSDLSHPHTTVGLTVQVDFAAGGSLIPR